VNASRVLVALRVNVPATRAFAAFTGEIGEWWQPNDLFRFTDRTRGRLAFEPDPPQRLVEVGSDGERFEIGAVTLWDPPRHLVFSWRQSGFPEGQSTQVSVRFDALEDGTRVTVEHFGWDGIPQENAARHGFPLDAFQQRLAEWWQAQLASLGGHVAL
jgi:uncharacterized protein YndB with AHSA1/START domain